MANVSESAAIGSNRVADDHSRVGTPLARRAVLGAATEEAPLHRQEPSRHSPPPESAQGLPFLQGGILTPGRLSYCRGQRVGNRLVVWGAL